MDRMSMQLSYGFGCLHRSCYEFGPGFVGAIVIHIMNYLVPGISFMMLGTPHMREVIGQAPILRVTKFFKFFVI